MNGVDWNPDLDTNWLKNAEICLRKYQLTGGGGIPANFGSSVSPRAETEVLR